ncbi:hypothetical protein [Actinoallomurus rhizosphaericola]|uniref:hypothetical protein n=1 Tax=Actinoallomurus rhizosphaericola TaxID=2952536 RepID=UPI002093711F|nr:hypothetical protein [Actinoallomurus rhizosphaericola]MCO5995747.1 hypothetical protein [Actinoallomurus rhizosphaericola]
MTVTIITDDVRKITILRSVATRGGSLPESPRRRLSGATSNGWHAADRDRVGYVAGNPREATAGVVFVPLRITVAATVATKRTFRHHAFGQVLQVDGDIITMVSGSLNAVSLLTGFVMSPPPAAPLPSTAVRALLDTRAPPWWPPNSPPSSSPRVRSARTRRCG